MIEHPFVAPAVTDDAYFGNTKEVHFFDYEYSRGVDWYRSHFPLERERLEFARRHGRPFVTGEASPPYLSHHWAPRRARKLLPNAKLIAVLRNPVDRAYSHFQLTRREGWEEHESFEDALRAEEERLRPELDRIRRDPRYNSYRFGAWSYLARSRYAEQVERWLEHFPREQFLFLKAEELFSEPARSLQSVYRFLGLPEHGHESLEGRNSAEYDPLPPETRAWLADYFRPHNERLYELVGVDFGWERHAAAVGV
jgi:hypothetical protein